MNSANNGVNNPGEDHSNTKGSPRMGRMRGISPQSREKAYMTGSNGGPNTSNFTQSA